MWRRDIFTFLFDRLLRRIVHTGELAVVYPDGRTRYYGTPGAPDACVRIHLNDPTCLRQIVLNPALGLGEAYMRGDLVCEQGDIRAFLNLAASNVVWEKSPRAPWIAPRIHQIARWISRVPSLGQARKNVAHHYDVGNALYALFLDSQWQYSCAYFAGEGDRLETAQQDKMAHIAAKLALKPGMHVLDIGCGWGGLALYLHRVAGVKVTGVTLAQEQWQAARARAEQAGVADQVDFQLIDYRQVTGQFDRIVSVGMFEHVGTPQYRRFFKAVRDLLTDDGVALIHTIARADGPGATDGFTEKYIFPGGYAPAVSEIIPAIEQVKLWITDIEVLRLHYAHTLDQWYDRCTAHADQITRLYDASFLRMWLFYLASSRTAFAYGDHMNVQIQVTRNRHALPLTRDYMAQDEARYRALTPPEPDAS